MSDLNQVTLTGRLVRDPIIRRGDSGTPWGFVTVASNSRYKDKGGALIEEVAFVACKSFGRWAEALAQHRKGDMVIVTGRLKTDSWEKDGRTQSQLTLVCDSLRFVMPQSTSSTPEGVAESEPEAREEVNGKDGKPPF